MTDYFAFYGLPLSFNPDPALIKQQFYAYSKKYHPDFYINQSEDKQAEVLELSTVNNKAYQVLTDPQKRLHYILELKGVLTEGEHHVLPQSFLMEMMDVNEALMELQFDPDPDKLAELSKSVSAAEEVIAAEISRLTAGYEGKNEQDQARILAEVKDLYYRNKYLLRIRDSIKAASK